MGQRHVASGIWSLGDLIRKQALREREREAWLPSLRESSEHWERHSQVALKKV